MSLESWKAEFYPVDVAMLISTNPTPIQLVEHCIKKWRGLLKPNLDKHMVTKRAYSSWLYDKIDCDEDQRFFVTLDTCALCKVYIQKNAEESCMTCPIYELTSRSCDHEVYEKDNEEIVAPYEHWCNTDKPERMIQLLEQTLEYVKAQPPTQQ